MDNEKTERSNKLFLIIGIIVFVIVITVLSLVLFKSCGQKSKKTNEPTTVSVTQPVTKMEEPVTTPEPFVQEAPVIVEEPTPVAEAEKTEVKFREITVQAGDSYYKIAEREFGDRHMWPYLYSLNQSLHDDPDMLDIGDKLIIPVIETDKEDFIEENTEDFETAYIETYKAYNNINKNYRAVRTLASGEIVMPGFLNTIQTRIPAADLAEARASVQRTVGYLGQ